MDGGYSAKNGRDVNVNSSSNNNGQLTPGDDFPQLCEICLGENPYVKMIRLPLNSKLCKISNMNYTAFRWKPGLGRHKETVISYTVAKDRGLCQCCLNDMQFGLPVGLRDKLLNNNNNNNNNNVIPDSNVGSSYYYENKDKLLNNNNNNNLIEYNSLNSIDNNISVINELTEFSIKRKNLELNNKIAFRNLPKLCSFWLNGTCSRVIRKTCPFRPCCNIFVFPELSNNKTNNELLIPLIKDLKEKGPNEVQKTLSKEIKLAISESQKGNKDLAIKKRVSGEDDLSKKYFNQIKSNTKLIAPPEDESITTLWIGNIEDNIVEQDLFDIFYYYGTIVGINIVRQSKCAFIEYTDRKSAEYAANTLYNALNIKGHKLSLNWSKPRNNFINNSNNNSNNNLLMPIPPGMESVPSYIYSLPNMNYPNIIPINNNNNIKPPLPPVDLLDNNNNISEIKDDHTQKKLKLNNNNYETLQLQPKPLYYNSMNPERLGTVNINK